MVRASWLAQGPLVPPTIHVAQHERAGRAEMDHGPRGRLYRWSAVSSRQPAARPSYTVSPAGQRHLLQTLDQGPAGFVALPPIRQSSTWEVAPRGGMVSRGGESHPGNEPGRSTCAGPGPLLPVSFVIRLTTAPLPGTAQAVDRQKKAPPGLELQRGYSSLNSPQVKPMFVSRGCETRNINQIG